MLQYFERARVGFAAGGFELVLSDFEVARFAFVFEFEYYGADLGAEQRGS